MGGRRKRERGLGLQTELERAFGVQEVAEGGVKDAVPAREGTLDTADPPSTIAVKEYAATTGASSTGVTKMATVPLSDVWCPSFTLYCRVATAASLLLSAEKALRGGRYLFRVQGRSIELLGNRGWGCEQP